MILEWAVRVVAATFLLQPPLTALLAKRLGLTRAFAELSPVAQQVAQNMAVAAIALPTSAGVVIAVGAHEVVTGGSMRLLACVFSAFWTFRLYRQALLWPLMPRAWAIGLTAIFVTQGPVFGVLIALARWLH